MHVRQMDGMTMDDGGVGVVIDGEEFEIGRHEWKRERQTTLLFRCIIYHIQKYKILSQRDYARFRMATSKITKSVFFWCGSWN